MIRKAGRRPPCLPAFLTLPAVPTKCRSYKSVLNSLVSHMGGRPYEHSGKNSEISRSCVGGDAHIAPLGSYEFALDFRKNGSYCRGDVGIAPYEEGRSFTYRPGSFSWARRQAAEEAPAAAGWRRWERRAGDRCGWRRQSGARPRTGYRRGGRARACGGN